MINYFKQQKIGGANWEPKKPAIFSELSQRVPITVLLLAECPTKSQWMSDDDNSVRCNV